MGGSRVHRPACGAQRRRSKLPPWPEPCAWPSSSPTAELTVELAGVPLTEVPLRCLFRAESATSAAAKQILGCTAWDRDVDSGYNADYLSSNLVSCVAHLLSRQLDPTSPL